MLRFCGCVAPSITRAHLILLPVSGYPVGLVLTTRLGVSVGIALPTVVSEPFWLSGCLRDAQNPLATHCDSEDS